MNGLGFGYSKNGKFSDKKNPGGFDNLSINKLANDSSFIG
jgi:hypothetical protein